MAHHLAYWATYADYGFEGARNHVCKVGYGAQTFWDLQANDTVWVVINLNGGHWALLQRLLVSRVYLDESVTPALTRAVADKDKSAFFELEYQNDISSILTHVEFETGKHITAQGAAIGMSIQRIRRLSPRGVECLVGYSRSVLNDDFQEFDRSFDGQDPEEPRRRMLHMNQHIRNPAHVRRVKEMHDHTCQVCGQAIQLPGGKLYAEVHHVKPLGGSEPGPDTPENMMCVCPNCHVRLDFGAIRIDKSAITSHREHDILDEYVE